MYGMYSYRSRSIYLLFIFCLGESIKNILRLFVPGGLAVYTCLSVRRQIHQHNYSSFRINYSVLFIIHDLMAFCHHYLRQMSPSRNFPFSLCILQHCLMETVFWGPFLRFFCVCIKILGPRDDTAIKAICIWALWLSANISLKCINSSFRAEWRQNDDTVCRDL